MANKTVYPYGTEGRLPSSIGLINDLDTGGVDKALTAQQGKVIKKMLTGEWVVDPGDTGFVHYKDGYLLLASSSVIGSDIDDVSTYAQTGRQNIKIPLSGYKKVKFYEFASSSGYGSLVIDADEKVLAAYTKTTGAWITTAIPEGAAYLVYSRSSTAQSKITLYGDSVIPDVPTVIDDKVANMPTIGNFNGDSDLDIVDEYGYVIGRFASGDFKTKNFDSTGVNTKLATIEEGAEVNNIHIINTADGDLVFADGNGNILAKFKNGGFQVKNFDSSKSEKKVKILCIGNSWTCDSFEYVGALLNEILADELVDIHIGVCYEGGASLQTHYNNLSSNNTYTFYEWTNSGDSWAKSTKAINTVLALDSWDIVILQQVSNNAGNYATYQPYLNDCLDLISERVSQTVKFGWNLVRERVTAPLTDFADISTTAQGLLQKTLIQFIIPSGTATQNARTTSLDSLGTGGHLTYDGSHLQDGLPCLVEAYATTLFLLSLFGFGGKGLNGSQFRPTQTWIDAHGMNGQANGSSVGVTESNVVLAKKCATIAVNNPYVVTDCSNL